MDPRLKVVVILLVGATIGAIVAGGALSYAGGNRGGAPYVPVSYEPSSDRSASAAPYSRSENVEGEDRRYPRTEPNAPGSEADEDARRKPLLGSDGPQASVTTNDTVSVPVDAEAKTKKAPVVEEESAVPRVTESEGEGGSLREEGFKGDEGGSVR